MERQRATYKARYQFILLGLGILSLLAPAPSLQAVYQPEPETSEQRAGFDQFDPQGRRFVRPPLHDEPAKATYAPGELIVKYKPSVTECVHCLLKAKRSFRAATTDASDSLDRLHAKYKVVAAAPVFRTEAEEARLPRTDLATLQQAQHTRLQTIKSEFATRTRRAPEDAILPDLSHIYRFELAEGVDVEAAVAEFQQDSHVEYAQPNHFVEAFWVPNDPYYHSSGSWGQPYDDLWGLKKIQVEQTWDLTQGQGIAVAVVDTGLDYNHPDIAANAWTNPNEIPGNGLDDDANGFIDDTNGWNFANSDNDPMDGHGHGTHVSGTIAAVGNNGIGIIGVAPQAKIMPLKGLTDSGSGSSSDLAEALVYAATNGADVLNNSWGCGGQCPSNPVIEDAVRIAYGVGTVVIFAAGNSMDDIAYRSPQNMAEVIAVAATTPNDDPTFFTSGGALLDVSAPGGGTTDPPPSDDPFRNILSLKAQTCNPSMCDSNLIVGTDYVRQAGTSMAAPHVAGLAALVLGQHPEFTPEEVHSILRATADDIGKEGFDQKTGYGRVNAAKATRIDTPCVASIRSPAPGSFLPKPSSVSVEGSADCRSFDRYTLEVDEGATPSSWVIIGSGTDPVKEGLLGTWDASSAGDGTSTLRLTVFNADQQVFRAYSQLLVFRNLHEGWPKDFGVFESPAAYGDLDGDGLQDLVFSSIAADLTVALKHNGEPLPGWPIDWKELAHQLGSPTEPAIGDIDGDGDLEVVVGAPLAFVYAFHGDGTVVTGWPQGTPPTDELISLPNSVTLVDLDRDGTDEVVAGFSVFERDIETGREQVRFEVHVWQGDGVPLPGWPQVLPPIADDSGGVAGVVLLTGDVNGDKQPEIAAIESTGQGDETAAIIFDRFGQMLPGWPVRLARGEYLTNHPAFGDLTGDGLPELIFTTARLEFGGGVFFHKTIHALQPDGTYPPGWPINADSLFPDGFGSLGLPTLGDLNDDGTPEILIAVNPGCSCFSKIAVFRADSSLLPGWPVTLENPWATSPLIADVDGDSRSDIVVGTFGEVSALDRAGNILPDWPKPLPGYSVFSPTIGDIDGDSKLELLVGGGLDTPLFLYDLDGPADPHTLQWPMLLHDSERTGRYEPPNRAPLLSPIGNKMVKEGELLTFSVSATDPDRDALSYSASLLPSGASFDAATQTFSWTPAFDQAGNYSITFAVSDGSLTDSETIIITVVDVLAPDLILSALSTTTPPLAPGARFKLSNTVKNQGPASAGTFTIAFHLSVDALYGGADDMAFSTTRTVSALGAGASSAASTTLTIPSTTPFGSYYVCALSDSGTVVGEAEEANNSRCTASPIQIAPSDLIMSAVSGPSSAVTGTSIVISSTVTNQGVGTDGPFYVGFYLSSDATITTADRRIGSRSVSSLAAGSSSSATTTVTVPTSLTAGTYYLGAIVDYNNRARESDETNNGLLGNSLAITIGPDLVMSAVSGPTTATRGSGMAITSTVTNQGIGASGSFYVGFYLSSDATITTADRRIGSRSVSSLNASASSTATSTVTIPTTLTSGSYYLGAIADYTNKVKERNEANNSLTGNPITIL